MGQGKEEKRNESRMKRALADTNFYGLLAKDAKRSEIVSSIKAKKELAIYGFKIVRSELRDVPKKIKLEGKNLRIDLLNLYDEVTGQKSLQFTDVIAQRADDYYRAYREFGGSKSRNGIINDFVIVACASLNNLDIVVSNDEKSMLAENAVRAYRLINSVVKKRTPQFISYEKLKNILGGEPNELF